MRSRADVAQDIARVRAKDVSRLATLVAEAIAIIFAAAANPSLAQRAGLCDAVEMGVPTFARNGAIAALVGGEAPAMSEQQRAALQRLTRKDLLERLVETSENGRRLSS